MTERVPIEAFLQASRGWSPSFDCLLEQVEAAIEVPQPEVNGRSKTGRDVLRFRKSFDSRKVRRSLLGTSAESQDPRDWTIVNVNRGRGGHFNRLVFGERFCVPTLPQHCQRQTGARSEG